MSDNQRFCVSNVDGVYENITANVVVNQCRDGTDFSKPGVGDQVLGLYRFAASLISLYVYSRSLKIRHVLDGLF